jgi:large subunit ribosomal protein L6
MSRIGKKPIPVPSDVKVELRDRHVQLSGPKGTLAWEYPESMKVAFDATRREICVERPDDQKQNRALHGLTRALIANMVHGVKEGYAKSLEIYGTGYGCKLDGQKFQLNVGFMGRGVGRSAQFIVDVPKGLEVKVTVPAARGDSEPAKFTVSGADKQLVGQFAAEIRKLRPPEPYKGKGIRYSDEIVRRKAGKTFAGGGAG